MFLTLQSAELSKKSTEAGKMKPLADVNSIPAMDRSSKWLVEPYSVCLWFSYMLLVTTWPFMVIEFICQEEFGLLQGRYSEQDSMRIGEGDTMSCIHNHFHSANYTNSSNLEFSAKRSNVLKRSIDWILWTRMVTVVAGPVLFTLVWSPLVRWKNAKVAAFFPPILLLVQAALTTMSDDKVDKSALYLIVGGASLPIIFGDFQGLIYLYYYLRHDEQDETKKAPKIEILPLRLHFQHSVIFLVIAATGFAIVVGFDLTYSLVTVFVMMCCMLCCLYATMFEGDCCTCMIANYTQEAPDLESPKAITHQPENSDASSSCDSEDEKELIKSVMKKDTDLRSMIAEVPIIFTDRSYEKELLVMIFSVLFTFAIIGDMFYTATFILHQPFNFTITQYGYCIMMQGAVKFIAALIVMCTTRVSGLRHEMVLTLALINYIIYYLVLGTASSKLQVYMACLVNVFGGFGVPTLLSYIRLNIHILRDTMLILAIAISLLASMLGTIASCAVYINLHDIYSGSVFLMWAGILVAGSVLAMATYLSGSSQSARRSAKKYKKLLNDDF